MFAKGVLIFLLTIVPILGFTQIGIGTTSPVANSKLDIREGGISIGGVGNLDATLHIKASYGGYDRLTQIAPSGNSKPAFNLMASTNSSGSGQWWVWGVDDNVWKIQPNSNPISSFTGSTGFFINSSGDIGIGITSPLEKLDVVGNIKASGTFNKINLTAPTTSATLTLANNSSLITSGAYSTTLTSTATTAVTLPTSGTLTTLAGAETLTNKTISGSDNTISNVSLSSSVTGTLPLANGGTGASNTSDAITNLGFATATYIAATKTSAQSISSSTTTRITNFSNNVALNASEWSATNGVFTATKTGIYAVSAIIQMASINTSNSFEISLSINKNGSMVSIGRFFNNYSTTWNQFPASVQTNTIVQLNSGDTIDMNIWHNSGASWDTYTSGTYFTIQELPAKVLR